MDCLVRTAKVLVMRFAQVAMALMKNAHAYTPDPLSRGGFFAGLAMD